MPLGGNVRGVLVYSAILSSTDQSQLTHYYLRLRPDLTRPPRTCTCRCATSADDMNWPNLWSTILYSYFRRPHSLNLLLVNNGGCQRVIWYLCRIDSTFWKNYLFVFLNEIFSACWNTYCPPLLGILLLFLLPALSTHPILSACCCLTYHLLLVVLYLLSCCPAPLTSTLSPTLSFQPTFVLHTILIPWNSFTLLYTYLVSPQPSPFLPFVHLFWPYPHQPNLSSLFSVHAPSFHLPGLLSLLLY